MYHVREDFATYKYVYMQIYLHCIYIYIHIQYEHGLCGVGSCSYGRRERECRTSVVKALKDFVEQMSDHDDLLQSDCWPVWTGPCSICH